MTWMTKKSNCKLFVYFLQYFWQPHWHFLKKHHLYIIDQTIVFFKLQNYLPISHDKSHERTNMYNVIGQIVTIKSQLSLHAPWSFAKVSLNIKHKRWMNIIYYWPNLYSRLTIISAKLFCRVGDIWVELYKHRLSPV